MDGEPLPKPGDLVQFCIAVENRNGNMRATRLKTRLFKGKVESNRGRYGVIEFHDPVEAPSPQEDQSAEVRHTCAKSLLMKPYSKFIFFF